MPAASAASLIDLVLAVRHSLSAPICENPSVIFLSARSDEPAMASAEIVTAAITDSLFVMTVLTMGLLSVALRAVICVVFVVSFKVLGDQSARKTRRVRIEAPRDERRLGAARTRGA